jgi:Pyruvate/2-oxoacid:ferredoxin oxidoreductase gamma subunit
VSCFVVFSDRQINSPFADAVDHLVFFNEASFNKFREYLRPGVRLMYNSSEVEDPKVAEGVRVLGVPLYDLVADLNRRCANMAMLGAFAESTRLLGFEALEHSFRRAFTKKGEDFITMNLKAIAKGREWAQRLPEAAPVASPSTRS